MWHFPRSILVNSILNIFGWYIYYFENELQSQFYSATITTVTTNIPSTTTAAPTIAWKALNGISKQNQSASYQPETMNASLSDLTLSNTKETYQVVGDVSESGANFPLYQPETPTKPTHHTSIEDGIPTTRWNPHNQPTTSQKQPHPTNDPSSYTPMNTRIDTMVDLNPYYQQQQSIPKSTLITVLFSLLSPKSTNNNILPNTITPSFTKPKIIS